MMNRFFHMVLFILFYTHVFGQQHSIIGQWRTPPNFSVLTYVFDSTGHMTYNQRGCMNSVSVSGKYSLRNDSIFIYYDTLTSFQRSFYRIDKQVIPTDTLLVINAHKIQLHPNIFMYNQDRDEQVCTITSDGLFTFKIRHFGDMFTIKQFMYNEWKTIDTLLHTNNDYIDLVHYPLFLHSGENKFAIFIHNNMYLSSTHMDGISITAKKAPVTIENKKSIHHTLTFSDTTIYEVQDVYGRKLLWGKGKSIDCEDLSPGKYVLNFDNRTTEFFKR